jgi:heptosyltransferase-2
MTAGTSIDRLLVRMPNWLGDLLMAVPALRAVRRAFAGATLVAAAPRALADLLALVPEVDEVVPLAGGSSWALIGGHHPDVGALAASRVDAGLLLTNSFASALALRRAGVPERWGYGTKSRRVLLTRSVARAKPQGDERHHAAYYTRLVSALGAEPGPHDSHRIEAPGPIRERGRDLLERHGWQEGGVTVAMAPGAAYGGAKRWPPAHVADVVRTLTASAGVRVVLVGATADRDSGIAVERALAKTSGGGSPGPPALVNLIGQTTLVELVGVLSACAALVSNDSGAMHLASALGLPVVAVFGPTREAETRPLGPHALLTADVFCRPCMLRDCPIDHRCMRRIAPRRAVEALAALVPLPGIAGSQEAS